MSWGIQFNVERLELFVQHTPWKINMEHTNLPFRKENDLPNLYEDMFHVNLPGCILVHFCFKHIMINHDMSWLFMLPWYQTANLQASHLDTKKKCRAVSLWFEKDRVFWALKNFSPLGISIWCLGWWNTPAIGKKTK